ncbi:hypothetical protein LAC03_11130 [Levilactobacillus acidifarinae]|nr:hypothetical protein LAC03_11130 [Levilactobacillus acidifarinae]
MTIQARRFEVSDAEAVALLVARTLRESNSKDYSGEYIEKDVQRLSAKFFIEKSKQTHFYVFCDQNQIVGTGAIGPYWGSETEFSLFDIFVSPDHQGQGIGRLIIETLEADVDFKCAQRIEIPASITGLGFYRHMGYDFKDGNKEIDNERLYRLEKFPKRFNVNIRDNVEKDFDLVPTATVSDSMSIEELNKVSFDTLREITFVIQLFFEGAWVNDIKSKIVMGMIVRIVKLAKSVLRSAGSQNFSGQETLSRLIFETLSKLNFILHAPTPLDDNLDRYLKDGLRFEKILTEKINDDIYKQSENESPIQARMLSSISETELFTGISEDRVATLNKRDSLPSMQNMSNLLDNGERLYMVYRACSVEVHGGPTALRDNVKQLEKEKFEADFRERLSDARVLDSVSIFLLMGMNVLTKYNVIVCKDSEIYMCFKKRIKRISSKISEIEKLHEQRLSEEND